MIYGPRGAINNCYILKEQTMKYIIITLIFLSFSKYSFADRLFQVSKIDCIPEIRYFEIRSRLIDSWNARNNNKLNSKHAIFNGDFSYQCEIGIRKIKLEAKNLKKFNKNGGVLKIFVDGTLVHTNNSFIAYPNFANKSETYFFGFLSDSKRADMVNIQHCADDGCSWISRDVLKEINYSDNY